MTAIMKPIVFLSLTSLITLGILPEAKAQSRMGMMMMRQQMMMNSGMMNMGTTSPVRFLGPPLMNPGMISSGMIAPFPGFPYGRWGYGLGGYGLGGYGLGGYGLGGYGGLNPGAYLGSDNSSNGYSPSRRQRSYTDDPPASARSPEEERERTHQQELAWSQSDLSEHETRSAAALNILLVDLQQLQAQGIQGPDISLDERVLQHINVIVSGGYGNAGVLRDEGRIHWPASLTGPEFDRERNQISVAVPQAIETAKEGASVDAREIRSALTTLRQRLAAKINDWPSSDYIRAKRFLASLDDALRVLRQSDAGNYFNGTYAAKGNTVAELVRYMTDHNLRFAPALDGDEPAYKTLHRALAQADRAAHEQSVAQK